MQVPGGLTDLPRRHASRTGYAAPGSRLVGRDEVGRSWTHDDVAQAAAHLPSVIVDPQCLLAGKPRTDKRPSAQPFVTKIDWADVAVATRAVDMDLKAECSDVVESPEREGAQHAPQLVRGGSRIIGLQ
jgi:hypothetical protein